LNFLYIDNGVPLGCIAASTLPQPTQCHASGNYSYAPSTNEMHISLTSFLVTCYKYNNNENEQYYHYETHST